MFGPRDSARLLRLVREGERGPGLPPVSAHPRGPGGAVVPLEEFTSKAIMVSAFLRAGKATPGELLGAAGEDVVDGLQAIYADAALLADRALRAREAAAQLLEALGERPMRHDDKETP